MLDHLSGGRCRVRHRPRRREPRDPRLPPRHEGPHRHARDLGRRDPRVPEDVDAGHLRGLRGQVLVVAAAQDPAQALREAAPADVVRRRQHVELRDGRALRPRRARLLGRQHRRARAGARGVQERHRQRRADRRVRERQRDGHQCGVRRRGPRGRRAVDGRAAGCRTCRATCSATTTRSRTPTGRRSGPSCSPTRPPRRCAPSIGTPGNVVGQPRRRARRPARSGPTRASTSSRSARAWPPRRRRSRPSASSAST